MLAEVAFLHRFGDFVGRTFLHVAELVGLLFQFAGRRQLGLLLGDFLGDLIKNTLGIKRVRSDTCGYLQRSFAGCVSEVDAKEARAVGRRAVQLSNDNTIAECSVVMRRTADPKYTIELEHTSIKNVAKETKHLDEKYMANGNDITQAFVDYAKPLVGELPVVGSLSEL